MLLIITVSMCHSKVDNWEHNPGYLSWYSDKVKLRPIKETENNLTNKIDPLLNYQVLLSHFKTHKT